MQSGSGHHGQLHPRVQVIRQVWVTRQGQGQAGTSACGVPLLLRLLGGVGGASTHLTPAKSWRKPFGLVALACQSSAVAPQKNLPPEPFWLSRAGPSCGSKDSTVLARGHAPVLASPRVPRAPGCSSPFKARQQLMATCVLPWHALRALCAAGTGTTGVPARVAVPCPVAVPRTGAAGGWHRMSGCPAGAAWGACHHAGGR